MQFTEREIMNRIKRINLQFIIEMKRLSQLSPAVVKANTGCDDRTIQLMNMKYNLEIEDNFCENLIQDVRHVGFDVSHFDFHEYEDETDAYSQCPGDNLSIKFIGLEIMANKIG